MKLRKDLIGSYVYHKILNRNILIEEGKEEMYEKLGLDVFTKRPKPKLTKNVKDKEERHDDNSVNINGIDNDNNA